MTDLSSSEIPSLHQLPEVRRLTHIDQSLYSHKSRLNYEQWVTIVDAAREIGFNNALASRRWAVVLLINCGIFESYFCFVS